MKRKIKRREIIAIGIIALLVGIILYVGCGLTYLNKLNEKMDKDISEEDAEKEIHDEAPYLDIITYTAMFFGISGIIIIILGYVKDDDKEKKVDILLCPKCERPMRYIEQKQEWYCEICKEYLDVLKQSIISTTNNSPSPLPISQPPPPPE